MSTSTSLLALSWSTVLSCWERWQGQHLCICPPLTRPIIKRVRRHPYFTRPLSNGLRLSLVRQHLAGAFVVSLFDQSGPPHVTWFIRAPRVGEAIKGMSGRRLGTEIGQKSRERSTPFLTNCHVSIVFGADNARIGRSRNHVRPRAIFGSFLSVTSRAMSCSSASYILVSQTSTRPSMARLQIGSNNDRFVSTLAETKPPTLTSYGIFNATKNGETTEDTTGKINRFRQDTPPLGVASGVSLAGRRQLSEVLSLSNRIATPTLAVRTG